LTEDDQRRKSADDEDETEIVGENAAIDSESSASAGSADPSDVTILNLQPGAGLSSSQHEANADERTTPSPPAAGPEDAATVLAEASLEEAPTQLAEATPEATGTAASEESPPPSAPSSTPRQKLSPSAPKATRRVDATPPSPPARSPGATQGTGTVALPDDALTGKKLLDRFLVGRKIGAGGFGAVYEAVDELKASSDEASRIAIKVLEKKRIGDRLDVLIQEVSRSHHVSHPNILRVFELNLDGGFAFITMELLNGETLQQRLATAHLSFRAGHPLLSIEEVDHITEQLCNALAYCHEQDLVHSDIKPENIYLCDDGTVKVLDLGISQLVGSATAIRGYSASYGSPEQRVGAEPHPSDDIFSLGCVLYECFTGDKAQDRDGKRERLPPSLSSVPRRYRHVLERSLQPERETREANVSKIWRGVSPALRRRKWIASALALLTSAGVAAAGLVGLQEGKDANRVSDADQQIAIQLFLEATNIEEDDPGAARGLLIQALETDPMHEGAAERMARYIRETLPSDPVNYSLVWADFKSATEAASAGASQILDVEVRSAADALLEIDATNLPRSQQRSRFGAPLCVLPDLEYRREELDQLRIDLNLKC
jgi:serine/threonine protein kinase